MKTCNTYKTRTKAVGKLEDLICLLLADKPSGIKNNNPPGIRVDQNGNVRKAKQCIDKQMTMAHFGCCYPLINWEGITTDEPWLFLDTKPRDVGFQFDTSFIRPYDKEIDGKADSHGLEANTYRIKHIRRTRQDPRIRAEYSAANIYQNLGFDGFRVSLIYTKGQWYNASPHKFYIDTHEMATARGVAALGMAIQFGLNYKWMLKIKLGDGRGVCLEFNSDGASDVVEARDTLASGHIPSLMGWIDKHWRTKARDPEKEIFVRKHLRGRTNFRAFGFDCEIHVPPDAFAQRDKYAEERKEMKKMGLTERDKNLV